MLTPLRGGEKIEYRYPLDELRLAWRELLRNQPHDSLPGCSLDEVHRDMQQRFRSAQQVAQQVQREALAALAGQAAPLRPWEDPLEARSLVNPLPWTRVGTVELDLPPDLRGARNLMATTPDRPLPVQLVGPANRRRAVVTALVPGFGACQVALRRGSSPAPSQGAGSAGPRAIENQFYRVEVAPDGTLGVTDRITGRRWAGLLWFQDEADRGDEYSFCPVDGDLPWDSRGLTPRVRLQARGPLIAELEIDLLARLPRELSAGRRARSKSLISCPIRTVVRLAAGTDRIQFTTTVLNRVRDHRLRVRFPAPESDLFLRAEGHYAVLRRPALPIWNGQWREPPAKTHHTLGVVAAGRLALFSRGLPEYEAIPNESGGVDLALTLLRCVGWLSCPDLSTRPGAEEPHIPTPDAQCLGRHTFEYAISLRGDATDAELLRASLDYRVGLVPGPCGADPAGALSLQGDGFAFAALKGAEDGEGAILRLYNPGSSPSVARVAGPHIVVRRCRLDESCISHEEIETVALRPGEIGTLMITRHNPHASGRSRK